MNHIGPSNYSLGMNYDEYLDANFPEVENLPDQTYWGEKAESEYWKYDKPFTERLNLIRHLFVNDVPLFMLFVEFEVPEWKWIQNPFETSQRGLHLLSRIHSEGHRVGRVEFIPIKNLNRLHKTRNKNGKWTIHDHTNWVERFGGQYRKTASLVFDGLTEGHQERLLPDESRHLLVENLPDQTCWEKAESEYWKTGAFAHQGA